MIIDPLTVLERKVAELETRIAALEARLGRFGLITDGPASPLSGARAKVTPPDEAA